MQEARLATFCDTLPSRRPARRPRPRRPTTMASTCFGARRLDDHFGGIAPRRLRLDGRDPALSRSFVGLLENAIQDGVKRGAEIFFSTSQTPQFLARETSQTHDGSSAAGRAGTPDEVGTVGALLMGPDGAFITGSDFLMDGGVTAAYWFGELAPK